MGIAGKDNQGDIAIDTEPFRLTTNTLRLRVFRAYSIIEVESIAHKKITFSEIQLIAVLAAYLNKKVYLLKYEVMVNPYDKPEDIVRACRGK